MGEEAPSMVEQAATEMDEMLTSVMPNSWDGFGRLAISERDFSPEEREFAQRLYAKLSEKYPDADAEMLAEKAIEKTDDKL